MTLLPLDEDDRKMNVIDALKIPYGQKYNPVEHPDHYNQLENIECIDVVENFNFNLGNVIKYVWRAGFKTNNPLEDLKKAEFYIKREIERVTNR
jgi:hypothetical protein